MTAEEIINLFDQSEKELIKIRTRICASDILPICMAVSEEVYREAVEIALQTSKKYYEMKGGINYDS